MPAPRLASLILLAVLAAAPRVQARSDDVPFQELHHQAQVELVDAMLQLATWSNEKELFLERDRLYRAVIEIDPDNAAARKGLRYSRKSDGSWQEPAPRPAKNLNAKALEELPAKRTAAVEPFRARMLPAIAKPDVDAAARRSVYREILAADPDDPTVHAEMGEARSGDQWVLAETVTAKARRADIKAQAKAALDDVGELHAEPLTEVERGLGLKFTQAVSTKHVRVLGTGQAAEVQQTARNCEAVGRFLRAVLDIPTDHQPGFTIYLLANEKEGPVLVQNLPGLEPDFRKFLATCVGAMIPGQPIIAYWDRDLPHRVDGCSRQTIGDFLGRTYGLTLNQGWAWEGLGLYLNRELTGTRLTWFIQMGGAAGMKKPLLKKLQNPETNWMNEALTLIEQPDHPRFETVLERDVNAMTIEDMLESYALAAYLLEGRPADLNAILHRIGGGKSSTAAALQEVLKMDLPTIEERVHRWLTERR